MGQWCYVNGLKYDSCPSFSSGTYELSCQHNPLVINVTHHPNVLSHHTTSLLLNFSSPLVGISAVALRTSSHTSPAAPSHCIPGHEGQNHQGLRYKVSFLPSSFPCLVAMMNCYLFHTQHYVGSGCLIANLKKWV